MYVLFAGHELKLEKGKNEVLLSDFGISEDGSYVYFDDMHAKKIRGEIEEGNLKNFSCHAKAFRITEEKLFREYQKEWENKKIKEQIMLLLHQRDVINDIQSKEDVKIMREKDFSNMRILEFELNKKMKIVLTIVGLKDDNTSKIVAKVLHEDVSDIKFETELSNICDEKNYTRVKNAFIYHSKDKLKLLYK